MLFFKLLSTIIILKKRSGNLTQNVDLILNFLQPNKLILWEKDKKKYQKNDIRKYRLSLLSKYLILFFKRENLTIP
jgi:hypothetical protein